MKRRNFFKMLGGVIGGLIVAKHLPSEEVRTEIPIPDDPRFDVSFSAKDCYFYAINKDGVKGWWTAKELTDDPNVMCKALGRKGWNTLRGNDLFYKIKKV
jgi:hypothetical protein